MDIEAEIKKFISYNQECQFQLDILQTNERYNCYLYNFNVKKTN